jgi:hypothetical protein
MHLDGRFPLEPVAQRARRREKFAPRSRLGSSSGRLVEATRARDAAVTRDRKLAEPTIRIPSARKNSSEQRLDNRKARAPKESTEKWLLGKLDWRMTFEKTAAAVSWITHVRQTGWPSKERWTVVPHS